MLSDALKYAERYGWYVFPVKQKDKTPLTRNGYKDASKDPAIIRSWWDRTKWPDANIGIACGKSSLVVIDLDEKHEGIYNWDELCGKLGIDNNTVTSLTGGGGHHLLYRAPQYVDIRNSAGLFAPGVDVRGNGGYFIAPPSIHPNGHAYNWELSSTPDNCELQPLPQAIVDLLHRPKPKVIRSNDDERIPEPKRNDTLIRMAGAMRRVGTPQEGIEQALLSINEKRCDSPLPEEEVRRIAKSGASYSPKVKTDGSVAESSNENPDDEFHITDLGNAKRLASLYGEDLRYCHPWKSWHVWSGIRWDKDKKGQIHRFADDTITDILRNAAEIESHTDRQKLIKTALSCQSHFHITGMISETRSLLPIMPNEFDQDHWVLNCENGTIDLRTGELRDHRRDDHISKIAPVKYDPDAKCPRWESFLNEIMLGRKGLVRFLQKTTGYALTGDTSEQAMFILYGDGENGKSVFLNSIMNLLGDYAMETPTETLMLKKDVGIPNDLARLPGARLVSASETEYGRRLSEPLVKQMTGQDKIVCRHLYGEWFDYYPNFKIFLRTNHKPYIQEKDHAIWRRIRLIPFDFRVDPDRKDPYLTDKLKGEYSGILNWAIRGCLAWQKEGLEPPDEVVEATRFYREEMDTEGRWLDENCISDSGAVTDQPVLFEDYKEWCKKNGEEPMNSTRFGRFLSGRGLEKGRKSTGNRAIYYRGVGLLANSIKQYTSEPEPSWEK